MAITVKVVAIFFVLLLQACSSPNEHRWQGSTMGTTYSVVVAESVEKPALDLLGGEIERTLATVNERMSTYIEDSEISIINRSDSPGWLEVSDELFRVLKSAWEISSTSGGAYDATVGPLVNLWGFGPGAVYSDDVPDPDLIKRTLSKVGYQYFEFRERPPAIRKTKPGLYVDLSSIAKGYGVDQVANLLAQQGIQNYLVEVGGELKVKGLSARGDLWKVAVEKPTAGQSAVQRILPLDDRAIATSGDYRNYFEKNGVRYSHTISAVTGAPVTHRLASVTVVADNAEQADGWATALLVLGESKGFELAEREGLAAYFVFKEDEGFTVKESTSFKRLFNSETKN